MEYDLFEEPLPAGDSLPPRILPIPPEGCISSLIYPQSRLMTLHSCYVAARKKWELKVA
jgi:hypothetical protein